MPNSLTVLIRVHSCPFAVKNFCAWGYGVHRTPSYRPQAGSYPGDVFTNDGAEDAFLKCLGEVCEKTRWKAHGYVDMRNDYHVA